MLGLHPELQHCNLFNSRDHEGIDHDASAESSPSPLRTDDDQETQSPSSFLISRARFDTSLDRARFSYSFDPIRILEIQPGAPEDPVRCSFEEAYIRHREDDLQVNDRNPLGEDPQYEALSYCWGDTFDKTEIQVNGCTVEVTRNLKDALQCLRRASGCRRLWVDALCINQSDDAEKSIQVARMFQVYEQAACVLVWLGPSSDNSDLALQTLRSLGCVDGEMEVEDMYRRSHAVTKLWIRPRDSSRLRNALTLSTEEKRAIENLFSYRKWWTRRWVIQEIAYADRAFLVCGSLVLDWDVLSNIFRLNHSIAEAFAEAFADWHWLRNAMILDQKRQEAQAPYLLYGMRRRGTTLRSLIWDFEKFECTEARDWIYCLLGLPSFPPGRITADYTKSCREVFIEATKIMISNFDNEGGCQNPSLNVICSAYRNQSTKYDLPSWVPDWSIPCDFWLFSISEDNEQIYNCCGNEPFMDDLSFLQDDVLQSKAIQLDEIIHVSSDQPWNHEDLERRF